MSRRLARSIRGMSDRCHHTEDRVSQQLTNRSGSIPFSLPGRGLTGSKHQYSCHIHNRVEPYSMGFVRNRLFPVRSAACDDWSTKTGHFMPIALGSLGERPSSNGYRSGHEARPVSAIRRRRCSAWVTSGRWQSWGTFMACRHRHEPSPEIATPS